MDYYVAEGKIESVTYVDDKKELKNIEPVLSGDDLMSDCSFVGLVRRVGGTLGEK